MVMLSANGGGYNLDRSLFLASLLFERKPVCQGNLPECCEPRSLRARIVFQRLGTLPLYFCRALVPSDQMGLITLGEIPMSSE